MKTLKECRVLVTPTSYGKNDPSLRAELEAAVGDVVYNTTGRPLSADSLLELVADCDGYIAGLDTINRGVIEKAKNLKVIARYGIGIDNVDFEAAREHDIVVTATPGANSASVAELTIGLILSLARDIPKADRATKAGDWPRMIGISLAGKIIGLVGFGAIGKQVAKRLVGFDCAVSTYDPFIDPDTAETLNVRFRSLEDLLSESDFLSLHVPLNNETQGMVNAVFLDKMKHGAFLINTSRGDLLDEPAVLSALQSGKLQGVALDVFTHQPPQADNPLLNHPHVIATPHMGAHTDGATNAMGWAALLDCLAVLRGEAPAYPVTNP